MQDRKEFMDFLRWWYEFEHNRHLRMNSSMTAVFAAQTAVLGIISTLFISNIEVHKLEVLAFLILSAGFFFSLISIYYSVRSYWGQTYEFIGEPKKVSDFYKSHLDWSEYCTMYSVNNAQTHLDSIYNDFFDRFSNSIDTTAKANDEKSKFRHISIGMLAVSSLLTGASYLMYA